MTYYTGSCLVASLNRKTFFWVVNDMLGFGWQINTSVAVCSGFPSLSQVKYLSGYSCPFVSSPHRVFNFVFVNLFQPMEPAEGSPESQCSDWIRTHKQVFTRFDQLDVKDPAWIYFPGLVEKSRGGTLTKTLSSSRGSEVAPMETCTRYNGVLILERTSTTIDASQLIWAGGLNLIIFWTNSD